MNISVFLLVLGTGSGFVSTLGFMFADLNNNSKIVQRAWAITIFASIVCVALGAGVGTKH